MKKLDVLDDTEYIMKDKVKELLASSINPEQAEKIELCPEINKKMDCATAKALYKCILQ